MRFSTCQKFVETAIFKTINKNNVTKTTKNWLYAIFLMIAVLLGHL